MAKNTSRTLRNMMIYQVYVRNHTKEGTFQALIKDLDRIKALGTDMLYLLPIHPIGEKQRKGELGSPYSIQDYYGINPELGSMDDFKALIKATHERGMKIMLDIVFNHTSYDSVLFNDHPQWFYQKDGKYTNRIGEWWDVVDFDYTQDRKLWEYLIENLVYYTQLGVDGFRFDVASLLPYDFLMEAREKVLSVNPASIWLTESVHGHFLKEVRDRGFEGQSESQLYDMFDMAYDYDAHVYLEDYLNNKGDLSKYVFWLQRQEEIYPDNYIKMRNLENHDFGRIAGLVKDQRKLENWHAFNFFSKGSTMIFGGGEFSEPHHPDLFNKDTIQYQGKDISPLIKQLKTLTNSTLFSEGVYHIDKPEMKDVIVASYENPHNKALGIFNVSGSQGEIAVSLEDGTYINAIDEQKVVVKNNAITLQSSPLIILQ